MANFRMVVAMASVALFLAGWAASATAQTRPGQAAPAPNWSAVKCSRYGAAWTQALQRFGRDGLGSAFLDRHEAFLASGCSAPRDICPQNQAELAMADIMTIAAMNAGTASTFLPFVCRG